MKNLISFIFCLLSISFCTQLHAQSFDKNDFTLIFEAGNLNSQVYETNSMTRPSTGDVSIRESMRFMTPSTEWVNTGGFSVGLKFSKSINKNIFDSKVSLDFISGISYKEFNIFQSSFTGHNLQSSLGIIDCFGFYYARDLKINSLEIPLELRSNISYKNLTISPILGIGVDIPLSKNEKLYYPVYSNESITRGDLINENKLEILEHYNFTTITKLEISYALPNDHKFKIAGFYNINISSQLTNQLWDHQGVSTKGIQIGYEIPLTTFVKNKAS